MQQRHVHGQQSPDREQLHPPHPGDQRRRQRRDRDHAIPCIFVYGGGAGLNVVEGNAMWNCGEAIQVVSDTVVRNNLILNSTNGITAAPHAQVAQMPT